MSEAINPCKPKPKIIQYIERIPDPRDTSALNFKHPLTSIIFIAFVSSLCGANDWIEVEIIGNAIKNWFTQFIALPNGIPSHNTFGRVFSLISPNSFNEFLIRWMDLIREKFSQDIISFDGKTLCGTAEKGIGIKGLHILNAWSKENGICIGQLKVDDKSNEITALPKLIELLDLNDCIVTTDALNTQKENAAKIKEAGADYVLPVKENHANLYEDIKLFFDEAIKQDFKGIDADHLVTIDKDHGRIEKRIYHIIDGEDLPDKHLWMGLKTLGMVIRERTINNKTTQEIHYYIGSIEIDAELFEKSARGHWGIECLHWFLDVVLREDKSRYRDKIGAQNLAVLRKITIGVLGKDKSKKCGCAAKRLAALGDSQYRERLLKLFL
jgi:predicted transposase YbfD/YdcC